MWVKSPPCLSEDSNYETDGRQTYKTGWRLLVPLCFAETRIYSVEDDLNISTPPFCLLQDGTELSFQIFWVFFVLK